jgi:hypothetical protein
MMKKTVGYLFLVLSFVVWGVIAALPFMDITSGQMAATTTALIISGEVLFLVSIALLGKEAWLKIKSIFKSKK